MNVLSRMLNRLGIGRGAAAASEKMPVPGDDSGHAGERGSRSTPENAIRNLYRKMWVDPELMATIHDLRRMDRIDPRVKRIHNRTASAAVKGGLTLRMVTSDSKVENLWSEFQKRVHLNKRDKLKSDARGLIMEGNLPLQWVLGADNRVAAAIRMPSETIVPNVAENGRFVDLNKAYRQVDLNGHKTIAEFALWQLTVIRIDPDNWDDQGCLGRPYLDASRTPWQKLTMTEEDMVIRRHMRAPQRVAHVLKGATPEYVDKYRDQVEKDQAAGNTTDYYMNVDGAIKQIEGDPNLDQIKDIVLILDSFFAGSPLPKGLAGYTDGLARDILEDIKRDFYEEVDAVQDALAAAYQIGFELELLLNGINPLQYPFAVQFAERRTETQTQAADRALKYQAMGASQQTVWETAGMDPKQELSRRNDEAKSRDPYPDPGNIGTPRTSITPGNAPKGESTTSVTTRN